jgi:hypothetical protein
MLRKRAIARQLAGILASDPHPPVAERGRFAVKKLSQMGSRMKGIFPLPRPTHHSTGRAHKAAQSRCIQTLELTANVCLGFAPWP